MTAATTRVPNAKRTSPNCIAVSVGNDYAQGRHSFKAGQLMVVDLDAVPKHDDFVVVLGDKPFGRVCYIAPASRAPRSEMAMGTLDADGQTIHMISLGKGGRQFGVVTGIVPSASLKHSHKRAAV